MLTWQLAASANKLFSYLAHVNQRRAEAKWGPVRGGRRPLCIASVITKWGPREKRGARSSVFFGCHPAAQRWPKLHPEVWIWGVLEALMCLDVCVWECGGSELLELLSTLSSSNWILVSVSHFDHLCEFFFVYLFPCWLLKSLDVSNGQTRNFISFEFWYILQRPQQRICHSISKEKSHIVV